MNILFAGTPEFAATLLEALIHSEHTVMGVLCQPDKPTGRGQKMLPPATKILAQQQGIPVLQPPTLKSDDIQDKLRAFNADIMVVAVYGLLLPEAVLSIPRLGCLNVHASILPRWRGASPIHQAILSGDTETGVTLMKMDVGLDTGDMLSKQAIPILPEDTTATLSEKLSRLGATLLIGYLNDCETQGLNALVGQPQDSSQTTHAPKISKQDAQIDWQQSAGKIVRQIQAFQPWPISFGLIEDKVIRFWSAEAHSSTADASPGTILAATSQGLDIATGHHTLLRAHIIQLPGKKPLPIQSILNGHAALFTIGKQFVINSGNL
jgi:methionyl-tRNA formyltransferase